MKKGFSIIELLVVMGIIAALVALAIPAISAMQKSYDSTGAESMISTALATARTLAISHKPSATYAGVRFQKMYNKKDPQINAAQYMIIVINDEPKNMGNLDEGFRAIEGYKPIKLPENIGVIDMMRRTSNTPTKTAPDTGNANERKLTGSDLDDSIPANLDPNGNNMNITDTSAFSIVFSPSGKLVIHDIRVRNKDGEFWPSDITGAGSSDDQVFNSPENIIIYNTGQFVQDDYADFGLGG